MAIDIDVLRKEVNTSAADDVLLTRCLVLATTLVVTYLADNLEAEDVAAVPSNVHDQAVLTAAADLFHQSKAPNGVAMQEYDVGDGDVSATPIRISRDPLRGARPVLDMYVGPAIG